MIQLQKENKESLLQSVESSEAYATDRSIDLKEEEKNEEEEGKGRKSNGSFHGRGKHC